MCSNRPCPCYLTTRGPVHGLTPQNCFHPLDKKFYVPASHEGPSKVMLVIFTNVKLLL